MALMARTRQRDHLLAGPGTLMSLCLAAGLPVASACSGRGACGKCVLTILQGSEGLLPPSHREQTVLQRNGAAPEQRLSCQCEQIRPELCLLVTTGYW